MVSPQAAELGGDAGREPKEPTRIQRARREEILAAALEVFSKHGFRGASINRIAEMAGMSTPRLLYHFKDKEALYRSLLKSTLLLWRSPLQELSASGEPVEEICAYVRRKLSMSQRFPKQSRLFAGEILMGVPNAREEVFEPLRDTFEDKIALITSWSRKGHITVQDPHHLIYSIWATTQHYADFEAQIAELSPAKMATLYQDAEAFLIPMYRRMLTPSRT
ncbi:MAG: TetR family transcriptional regulator C-terminal domain-containing protein [Pseudomonadota bacterium]